ncbi:MAG TPA: radical SAM protein [bacterium]|nr:radical SAM protein [bacterium]
MTKNSAACLKNRRVLRYARFVLGKHKARLKYFLERIWTKIAPDSADKRSRTAFLRKCAAAEKAELSDKPGSIVIEINNTCNLNCLMCETQSSRRAKGEIEPRLFKKIIDEMASLGYRRVKFTTVGEPLLNKNLPEYLYYCQERGINGCLITNGMLIKDFLDRLDKENVPLTHLSLRVSIDGGEKSTYEKIRCGASYEKLIENLDALAEYGRRKRLPVYLSAACTLNRDTIPEVFLFYHKFKKYFGEELSFGFMNSLTPRGNENPYFKDKNAIPAISVRKPCPAPFIEMDILYDGAVSLCCRDYEGELVVGNINQNTILEIWNGDKARAIREAHKSGRTEHLRLCSRCFAPSPALSGISGYIRYLLMKYDDGTAVSDAIYRFIEAGGK